MTYVAGGSPPYRAEIMIKGKYGDSSKLDIKKEIVSEDGWIRYSFKNPVTEASVELLIKDSKNITESNKGEFKKKKEAQGSNTDLPNNK